VTTWHAIAAALAVTLAPLVPLQYVRPHAKMVVTVSFLALAIVPWEETDPVVKHSSAILIARMVELALVQALQLSL